VVARFDFRTRSGFGGLAVDEFFVPVDAGSGERPLRVLPEPVVPRSVTVAVGPFGQRGGRTDPFGDRPAVCVLDERCAVAVEAVVKAAVGVVPAELDRGCEQLLGPVDSKAASIASQVCMLAFWPRQASLSAKSAENPLLQRSYPGSQKWSTSRS